MKGTIDKFKNHLGLLPKRIRKGPKKRSNENTVYRDYRGTRGAIDDAEGAKKK